MDALHRGFDELCQGLHALALTDGGADPAPAADAARSALSGAASVVGVKSCRRFLNHISQQPELKDTEPGKLAAAMLQQLLSGGIAESKEEDPTIDDDPLFPEDEGDDEDMGCMEDIDGEDGARGSAEEEKPWTLEKEIAELPLLLQARYEEGFGHYVKGGNLWEEPVFLGDEAEAAAQNEALEQMTTLQQSQGGPMQAADDEYEVECLLGALEPLTCGELAIPAWNTIGECLQVLGLLGSQTLPDPSLLEVPFSGTKALYSAFEDFDDLFDDDLSMMELLNILRGSPPKGGLPKLVQNLASWARSHPQLDDLTSEEHKGAVKSEEEDDESMSDDAEELEHEAEEEWDYWIKMATEQVESLENQLKELSGAAGEPLQSLVTALRFRLVPMRVLIEEQPQQVWHYAGAALDKLDRALERRMDPPEFWKLRQAAVMFRSAVEQVKLSRRRDGDDDDDDDDKGDESDEGDEDADGGSGDEADSDEDEAALRADPYYRMKRARLEAEMVEEEASGTYEEWVKLQGFHPLTDPPPMNRLNRIRNLLTDSTTLTLNQHGRSNLVGYRSIYNESIFVEEVRRQQSSTRLVIPPTAFERLVREISQDFNTDLRFEPEAVAALQEAAEEFIAEKLRCSNRASMHSKRITLYPKDIQFSQFMQDRSRYCL